MEDIKMKEFKYVVTDNEGIHARPAAEIAKSNKSGCGLAIIQSGGKGYGEKSF